jgi:uncharacterized protein YbcV (DUF1398 family)
MNREAVTAAVESARKREIGYLDFVRRLIAAGVQTYRVEVPAHTITYHSPDDTFIEQGEPLAGADPERPAPFQAPGVQAAIAANQQGKGEYQLFLRQIWDAGTVAYDVDFQARTIAYRGAHGEVYEEGIP